jgi:hypothetical protein
VDETVFDIVPVVEVLEPLAEGRDKSGRFKKGNNLSLNGRGRPKKREASEVLKAITGEFKPPEVRAMLREVHELAIKNNDPKTLLELLRLIAAYDIGKPVQRSITTAIKPEDFSRLWKDDEESGDEEEYIEVEE